MKDTEIVKKKFEQQITCLKKRASRYVINKKNEKALSAISVCADLMYQYNQRYDDQHLENMLLKLSELIVVNKDTWKTSDTILFYDGFGLDTRGLALIYIKGLVKKFKNVVYVTKLSSKGKLPQIEKILLESKAKVCYIETEEGYLEWANQLSACFDMYCPSSAFFYTTPRDVSATIVFNAYKDLVIRYQIDLTDHAFWLGKNAFDYCVALRNVGSRIAYNYRKIPKEKIVMFPYYAPIVSDYKFQGLPFDEGNPFIFSGGALYKTLGDSEKNYYKMVKAILTNHKDLLFVYAGYGDDSELKKLQAMYPSRVFHIDERKDYYAIMERCVFYMNTYPMFGGVMMNCAALAGKVPLTLKHNHDADGLLFGQETLGIEFDTIDDVVSEAGKLIEDKSYREIKSVELKNAVITEEDFNETLKMLITTHKTCYQNDFIFMDTREFREEYLERINIYESLEKSISKNDRFLLLMYPSIVIKRIKKKVRKKS